MKITAESATHAVVQVVWVQGLGSIAGKPIQSVCISILCPLSYVLMVGESNISENSFSILIVLRQSSSETKSQNKLADLTCCLDCIHVRAQCTRALPTEICVCKTKELQNNKLTSVRSTTYRLHDETSRM